jgi:putative nucleotidyltransferase with HDIG domain
MEGVDKELYVGRWVALLGGRVIAQGGTPEQARRAAQSRYKEKPEVQYMPTRLPLSFPPILDTVRASLPGGLSLYLAGGAVRDAFLGRPIHDLDFVLEREAIKTARGIANNLSHSSPGTIQKADFYSLDNERDTGRVIVTNMDGSQITLDFAAFRGPDLEADILGRDFTLNAIAIDLTDNSIHDPLGGVVDLKEKKLRACSASSFVDDPVRILRGIRLAANFGFSILPETRRAMKKGVDLLGTISAERLRDELFRILDGLKPATCIRALDLLGALEKIMPELQLLKGVDQKAPHVHDVWEHTLATVGYLDGIFSALASDYDPEKASDLRTGLMVLRIGRYRRQISEAFASPLTADRSLRSLLFQAALYHDVAKPLTKTTDDEGQLRFWDHDQQGAELAASRGVALALSNAETDRLKKVVRNHMRILYHVNRLVQEGRHPSRRAIYRFFRDVGPSAVDVCLLTMADLRATYEQNLPQETWVAALDVVRLMLENWYEKPLETIAPQPLVNGDDLMMEFNLQPGRLIGEMLEAIREGQAMGAVLQREQALELARRILLESHEHRGI